MVALLLTAVCGWAENNSERNFPQSAAEVQKALKTLAGGTSGPLPMLDGFVAPGTNAFEQYQRPFYKCTVTVAPAGSGSKVRVNAKITAWHNNGARSGYEFLPSNGRLESDLLDRLQQALGKTESAAPVKARSTSAEAPTIDAPTIQFPKHFEPRAGAAPSVPKGDPDLQREADNLGEILRNQSHPTNLVAVKKDQTPVRQTPALDGKVLFLASAEDEFEILEQNPDWIHVRISGLSRGWVRRSNVDTLDGSDASASEVLKSATGAPPATPSSPPAASVFSVTSEETGAFPGDWAPLKGKSVKIVSAGSSRATSGEEKVNFAEQMFQKPNASSAAAGLVIIFDTEDGGMIAATSSLVAQLQKGTLSEDAFWKQCYVDPPEMLAK